VNVEKPDGYFYIDINANGELNASKLHTMKNNYAVAAQVLLLPDNTVCLTGEHRSISSTLSRDKPGQYINGYSYGDMYITKFAADGSVAWDYTAKRDLKSVSDGGRFLASYTWLNGDDINLLFADYANQHDEKKRMIEFGSNRIDLIQTIGNDGKLKSEVVIMDPRIGGKRGDYYFIPATGTLYKDKKIFMLAARGQELVGATISY
jgi:hypothetical protein